MQYTDKFGRAYKMVGDRPFVWGAPNSWQPSAFYSTLEELLFEGEAIGLSDDDARRR